MGLSAMMPPKAAPPPAPAPAPTPVSVPVATSAEGCASGECLPEATAPEKDADEADQASKTALPAAERWKAAVDVIRLANPRLGKSLSFGRLASLGMGDARLAFPTDAGFHRATVFGHARAELEAVLTQHFGEKIRLVEEKSEAAFQSAPKSVAEAEASAKATRERDIEQKVRENPAVLSVLRVLGGTLEHVQVLEPAPRDEPSNAGSDDEA
jgi:hypothetical protein